MFVSSKMKVMACLLISLILLNSFAFSISAADVSQMQAQEVYFKAECPIDFNDVIVVTITSSETGYLYTYYLRPESDFEARPFVPYGKYSVAATISSTEEETDDAFSFLVTPESDTFVVKKTAPVPSMKFIVDGYTNSNESDPDESESNPKLPSIKDPEPSDSETEFQENEQHRNPAQTETDSTTASDESDANSSMWRSLITSVLLIVAFFVIGTIYRKRKEG